MIWKNIIKFLTPKIAVDFSKVISITRNGKNTIVFYDSEGMQKKLDIRLSTIKHNLLVDDYTRHLNSPKPFVNTDWTKIISLERKNDKTQILFKLNGKPYMSFVDCDIHQHNGLVNSIKKINKSKVRAYELVRRDGKRISSYGTFLTEREAELARKNYSIPLSINKIWISKIDDNWFRIPAKPIDFCHKPNHNKHR